MLSTNTIFYIVVLIMSVVVHEAAHGFAADHEGDPTARRAGRLTLNPLKHLDPVGSVLVPILLIVMHAGFVIGWAKPVPYFENNFRDKRRGTRLVASAGILVNIGIAVIFGLLIRFVSPAFGMYQAPFVSISTVIVMVNLLLAAFNLIPVPPLDGSKILFSFIPESMPGIRRKIEYFALPLLLLFTLFLWPLVVPAVGFVFSILTGHAAPFL